MEPYLHDLGKIDPKYWIFKSNQNKVYRESDLLPEDVRENHIAFRLYRDIFSDRQKGAKSKEERQAFLKQIASAHGLSDRETDVFLLISDGVHNDDICRRLFISMGTLKKHITSIYRKTGVGSKSELLAFLINLQK